MACFHCKKYEAPKTYEYAQGGRVVTRSYCLKCFAQLFLSLEEVEEEKKLSACPYCGTTARELQTKKLVGCAHCYQTLKGDALPMIIKMQGRETHKGKTTVSDVENMQDDSEDTLLKKKLRLQKQCYELEEIIEKLKAEKDFEGAKDYADKLSRMKSIDGVEEEFVWRTSNSTSKRL